jgi:hypothetical protein
MGLGFSGFGNIINSPDISFSTTKVPGLAIDTEIPTLELPEPEIKIPDPVVTEGTFQPSTDIFQSSSKPQSTSNIFTQASTIDWTNVKWEVSDISIDAFETDDTYSAGLIKDDKALQLAFADPKKNFIDIFNPDKFQDYENGDGKWSYAELKDFEKKLTELEAKGQLTPEQKKGLDSLRKETSQIEAQASRFAESGSNIEPDSIIGFRLQNGGQGFYDDLTKLSKTIKEQDARNSAAEECKNPFFRDCLAKENKTETRINELADKLIKNEYSDKEAKQKDLEEFMKLYTELGKAEKLEMKDTGIFEKIMNKLEIQTAIKNSIDESQKNFLDRYKELKELEKNGNISAAEKEILRKMEEQKDTILALQERIKNNPEEAYKYYQELIIAYAEAGDYKKAADMANGKVTATDTAEIQERAAQTDTERAAANVYTNVLISDPGLREKNKVDSQELDSWIKLKGGLDKVQQKYHLSDDVTAGIKSEMRSLYTNDQSTYKQYYDSSSSNYGNSEIRPDSHEFNLLSPAEKDAALGILNTKIAEKDAIKRLVKDLGIPQNIAIAIVTNNTSSLQEKALDVSPETASKYLSLAGLNATNPNTNYVNPFLGLSIS